MAGRIELPFLYQTRTIRARPRKIFSLQKSFLSTDKRPKRPIRNGTLPGDLFPAKAQDHTWAPLADKTANKNTGSGTTISSTITAGERRAFETILRFAPKVDEPRPSKQRPPLQNAIDTDIDNILKIFTSSVRDHELKRDAALGSRRVGVHREHKDNHQSSYRARQARDWVPRAEQRKAESAQQPEVEAESMTKQPEDQQQREPTKGLNQNELQDRSAFVLEKESKELPAGSSPAPAIGPSLHVQPMSELGIERANTTPFDTADTQIVNDNSYSTNLEQLVLPTADTVDATANEPLGTSLVKIEHAENVEEAPLKDVLEEDLSEPNLHQPEPIQFENPIQSAVRTRMHAISTSLEAAASSKHERGDIAMWKVVESEIFSTAKHFQSQATPMHTSSPFAGIGKFTFSKGKSDRPRQMIEVAEREQRVIPTSTPASVVPTQRPAQNTSGPLSQQSLQILQNVYPAALLLALRLYITHFPSSPYPFLLLPTIRSLGTTSYVLGASPQFYTSLLSLVWMIRGSLREIDGLLSEMERGGVEMDDATYAVLGGIEDERIADFESEKKDDEITADKARVTRGAAWWKRQEQMLFFPKILDWLDVIAGRLAAKERERLSVA